MTRYRRVYSASYAQPRRISPSTHLQFREKWDKSLDEALKRAAKLRREGWHVELNRGALTKSQAARIAKRLELEAEVELIPITEWMGQEIVFIAYKEKSKPKTKVTEKTSSASNALSKEQLFERFRKICLKSKEPSPEHLAEGYMMDDHWVMAAVAENSTSTLAKQRDKLQNNVSTLIYAGKAENRLIRTLKNAEKQGYRNVRVGPTVVRIDNLIKALKVLKGTEFLIRTEAEGQPLWLIQRQNKNSIVIAPIIKPYDEASTKNFSEVLATIK